MSNTSEWTAEHESFFTSYLIAHRIFGYLFVNRLIKEPKTGEAQAAYLSEFAGFVREVSKNIKQNDKLDYVSKYGLDGIISAIEFDISVRGNEWELRSLAEDTIKRLKVMGETI